MMKRIPLLMWTLLALSLATAGCASQDEAPASGAATEGEINLTGDFEGPLGLQLYSVRHALDEDLDGTLQRLRDLGIREAELAGTYGLSPEAFRQKLDSVGIDATSMHAGYERFQNDLEGVLSEAEALGVDYVGIAWIPHTEGQPYTVEMARQAAADFNRWGAAARERGLRFFYHVHGYEFRPDADGTKPFDVLVAETNPEDVAFEMDVFWVAHPGEDPVALLQQYPDRWELMHIKDMKEGTASDYSGHAPTEANVAVGMGTIDYPAVLQTAEQIGVKRYYIEDETSDPLANIPRSIEYLSTVAYPDSTAQAAR